MKAWDNFKKNIEKNKLVEPGDKILIAVSGGPDSVCLMHLLWRLKKSVPIEITVVNMDHGLRNASKKESEFVQKLASKYGITAILKKISVKQAAGDQKISLETAGRNLRYSVLAETAKKLGFNKIATGHTADDNAETLIMWMLRGTGTDGLGGIPLSRRVDRTLEIIRPILPVTKQEVFQYLRSQKIPYKIDKSNFRLNFTRNRIRHRIIGELRKYNNRVVEHLYNLSRVVSAENEYLEILCEKALKKLAKIKEKSVTLDLNEFFRYNKTIQSRVIKSILPERISAENIEKTISFLFDDNKKQLIFSKRLKAVKNKRKARFYKLI